MTKFFDDIRKFNAMYKMEAPSVPEYNRNRMYQFSDILAEEMSEFDELHEMGSPTNPDAANVDFITAQADLYGDIIIYCCSEMHRIGLNPEIVLGIIMQSNFSKLGEDGLPIYDERGKVMKGPNYWKPEPELKNYIELARSANSVMPTYDTDVQDNNEEENGS